MSLSDKQDVVLPYNPWRVDIGDGYGSDDGDGEDESVWLAGVPDCPFGDGFCGNADGDGGGEDVLDAMHKLWLSGIAMSGPAFDDLIRWSVRDEFV